MSSEGMKVKMDSLESLLDGGITMGLPPGWAPGEPVKQMDDFTLFRIRPAYWPVVWISSSTTCSCSRTASAACTRARRWVSWHRVGTVISAPISSTKGADVPEPADPGIGADRGAAPLHRYANAEKEQWRALFGRQFKEGLRATLKTSSLLTGGKVVDLNFYPDAPKFQPTKLAGYQVFPTVQAGLDQIERKVNQILDKFVDMDTAKTLNQVNHTLVTLEQTLKNVSAVSANLDKFTGQSATQQLPASSTTA